MTTIQEAFDTVVKQQREQGEPSIIDDDVICQYKGEFNLRCAVGGFLSEKALKIIVDNNMNEEFLGKIIASLKEVEEELKLSDTEDWYTFWCDMQNAHDDTQRDGKVGGNKFLKLCEKSWNKIAKVYGITYTPPNK